ncbi:MAG TPA: MFS transporter [Bryobacteraceae bacterium]|nr:MFS transporter [Bryobacteraceae bacterium]
MSSSSLTGTPLSVSAYERATNWRMWVASGAMMLCSWLSYVDRQILAVLSPTILRDVHLSAQSYGEIVSAFSIAYMIANPIWGAVLDYIGLRLGMIAAVAIWTVASASHAWMIGFAGFAVCRGLLGLGEGATFPGGFRASMDSLPKDRQARGMAISYSGGSLGAIFAPVVVVPVAQAFGWRAAFLVTGLLGLLWIAMWTVVARPPYLPKPKEKPKLASLNPFEKRFWALIASYSLGAVAIGPVFYLSPLYLNRVIKLSQADLGKVLWIPPLGWEIGYFAWGWIFDRYAAGKDRPVGMFLLLAACAIPFGFMTLISSIAGVLALFFWCMFVTGGFQMLGLRTGARAYPGERTASVAGVASGAWAAEAAVILPLTGRWFDQAHYDWIFWAVALVPAAGVLMWIALSRPPREAAALAA